MIPGLNLFNIAGGAIALQTVQYRQWLSRTRTAAGEFANTYAASVPIRGSWQPADLKRVAQLGLDLKFEYRQLWTSTTIQGVDATPGRGSDQVVMDGSVWEPTSTGNDWSSVDGWRAYIFVRVGAAP